jgi:hypothetical protein
MENRNFLLSLHPQQIRTHKICHFAAIAAIPSKQVQNSAVAVVLK